MLIPARVKNLYRFIAAISTTYSFASVPSKNFLIEDITLRLIATKIWVLILPSVTRQTRILVNETCHICISTRVSSEVGRDVLLARHSLPQNLVTFAPNLTHEYVLYSMPDHKYSTTHGTRQKLSRSAFLPAAPSIERLLRQLSLNFSSFDHVHGLWPP